MRKAFFCHKQTTNNAVTKISIEREIERELTSDSCMLPLLTNVSPPAQSTPNRAQMSPAYASDIS